MGFLGNLFKKSPPPTDAVKTTVKDHADGSRTVKTEFALKGDLRPVNDAVVTALDDALQKLSNGGSTVMHAMDPSRLLSFANGGPPIWSVGMIDVPGPRPYTLLVTYGFSHELSPEKFRESIHHEFSLAIPKGTPLSPWADAFLRHQTRYILSQGADIRLNDCVPLRGVPMTRVPFQPEHHAMMPDSSLIGVLATTDPVLPFVETPAGKIEVRRLVGIDSRELDRAETWSPKGFLEELRRVDPLLLSPLMRACHLDEPNFRSAVEKRFAAEGSDVDAALFDVSWEMFEGGVDIFLPETDQGRERLINAIVGRVGFKRRLVAVSMNAPPIVFSPEVDGARITERELTLGAGPAEAVLTALRAGQESISLG